MGLTIRDVEKAAGVSTATVSNVLNKTGRVGRRTHLLVLSTVKRFGGSSLMFTRATSPRAIVVRSASSCLTSKTPSFLK